MKKHTLGLAALLMLASSPMYGQVVMELIIEERSAADVVLNRARIEVDAAGTALCFDEVGIECADLTPISTPGAHGRLTVTTDNTGDEHFGQFSLTTTGEGGIFSSSPTLQSLNQIDASSTGAGALIFRFTDTDYGLGGGPAFGTQFALSASGVLGVNVATSQVDFQGFVDGANTIPAGLLIGQFLNQTGSAFAVPSTIFANPNGATGSLTSRTRIDFTGIGTAQVNFTISSIPEPANVILFSGVFALTAFALRRKFASVKQ
jgi:hypothetical protein